MNYTDMMLLGGVVVIAGEWSKKNGTIQPSAIIGLMVLAVFLTVIGEANAHLANMFAAMILVAILLEYGTALGDSIKSSTTVTLPATVTH